MNTASIVVSMSRNAGGLYESVRRLHQSLAEIPDVNVTVMGLEDEHTAADLAAWAPVTVRSFPVLGPRAFGYSPSLRRSLLATDIDILHLHGIWQYPSVAALSWHRRFARPYMISPHGMLDPWAVRNSALKKRVAQVFYENEHLKSAACIRALCQSEANSIRKFGLKNPICVIPNGIDLPRLDAESREQKAKSRNPISLLKQSGRKVLLYLGRIHPKKGLMNLIKAWDAIQRSEVGGQRSDWVLAIAGWDQGGHEVELKRIAEELGLSLVEVRNQKSEVGGQRSGINGPSTMIFLGPQFNEDKAACYRDCDAFILPSFSEGLPMAVLEAWAYAKPVLMTSECNLPEGFEAAAALRIEPTAESIEQSLREILFTAPNSQLQDVGQRGRALVERRFSWPIIAGQMKEAYDWLLGHVPKPGCAV